MTRTLRAPKAVRCSATLQPTMPAPTTTTCPGSLRMTKFFSTEATGGSLPAGAMLVNSRQGSRHRVDGLRNMLRHEQQHAGRGVRGAVRGPCRLDPDDA